jgi:hypothetical protein
MPVQRFDPSSRETPPEADPAPRQTAEQGGPEAVRRLQAQLEELADYVRLYLSARGDALVARLRALALGLVAGLVALAVLVALVATAAAIGMLGLADLIGESIGRPWAGYVITGFGFLAICGLGVAAGIAILRRGYRRRTVRKYAGRHAQERQRFGRDAAQAAARPVERG